jgi:hypothetical protein
MKVESHDVSDFRTHGPAVTPKMKRTHGDPKVAAEYGACGLALLIAEHMVHLTIWERSPADGGGFDYYMVPVDYPHSPDEENFFGIPTHVMEVSGISNGTMADITQRKNEKLERLARSTPLFPAFVIVVEFSTPYSRMDWL